MTAKKIVVYYRTRPGEPVVSAAALDEQKAAVAADLAQRDVTVVGEFCETDDGGLVRPALAAAQRACNAAGATLLIASVEAIGRGNPFVPNISSVPVEFLPRSSEPLGSFIDCPTGRGEQVALWLRRHGDDRRMSVCLANPGADPLTGIEVTSAGITAQLSDPETGGPLTTSVSTRHFPNLPAGQCLIVDHYDPLTDGDGLTGYEVSFADHDGQRRTGRIYVDSGGPTRFWIRLQMTP
ncbi:hypothetical protein V5F44_07385 [Xanthobacter sp. V2C-8]|uniref:hypothetical protein n=1 Tax=Xanthobacter albus TaxID=3119929 RepID=UPI00372CB842